MVHQVTERLSFRDDYQFAWDSTSLTRLKECPRKYYYSIVQGYATRAQSVHLTFGIYYHQAMELYHHKRAEGLDYENALRTVVLQMMRETAAWQSDDKYKNRFTLIRTIVWYLDAFKDDPIKTAILHNGKPAVELSFRFELPDTDFLYCGHMDRIGEFAGKYYVTDYKTTKSTLYDEFFAKFNPNNQMTGYTLGGKVTFSLPVEGVIIDGAQIGVGFSRFARGTTLRTPEQLDEWLNHTAYFVKLAQGYAKADFWPMNESACHNYGGCEFRPICSKAPRQRQTWLDADYVHRLWDPLQIRGDI
jgi:hypothetical protein